MKKETPEQQLNLLCRLIIRERDNWNYINENSCNDPFWPDGCNMNLTRNHIISYKRDIAELCEENGMPLPEEYFLKIPPEVDDNYMANPFAIFMRQDILQLALDMDRWYHEHLELFEKLYHAQPYGRNKDGSPKKYVPLESIVPEIYGTIAKRQNGELYTTGAQRTGCSMCGFGIHLEQRPHRFDKLRERNPKEWEFWMYRCCTDPNTGEKYGWGRVLDYIGVEWEDIPAVQMNLEDFLK